MSRRQGDFGMFSSSFGWLKGRFWRVLIGSVAVSLGLSPSYGAIGDEPAAVIATRTAPGETTAFVCGRAGFVIVQFFLSGALVSEIESGDTCSPPGGSKKRRPLDRR